MAETSEALGGTAAARLHSYFQRWERLEAEKAALSADLKELFAEAKAQGYDGKAMRAAFRRKAAFDARTPEAEEREQLVEVYLDVLGVGMAAPAAAGTEPATHVQVQARDARGAPAPAVGRQPARKSCRFKPGAANTTAAASKSDERPAGPPKSVPASAARVAEELRLSSGYDAALPPTRSYAATLPIEQRIAEAPSWPQGYLRNRAACADCGDEIESLTSAPEQLVGCGCGQLTIWGGALQLGRKGRHLDRSKPGGRIHPVDLALQLHDAGLPEAADKQHAKAVATGLSWRESLAAAPHTPIPDDDPRPVFLRPRQLEGAMA